MGRLLFALLIGIGFLDEAAGVGFVGTADIERDLGLSYATVGLAMFTVPGLIAMVLEPPLMLLAHDRGPRVAMVCGLAAMGLGLAASGLVGGWVMLAACSTVYFVGSGIGVNLAKTALVDAHPDRSAWVMARWTLAGALGDIAAPLLLAVLATLALGWRSSYAVVGGLMLAAALLVAAAPVHTRFEDDEEGPGTWQAVKDALGNRLLFMWLFASATCGLLDEVFVAFAGLFIASEFGASTDARSVVLAAFMVGGVLGVTALERVLAAGVRQRRVLQVASLLTGASLLAWIFAPSLGASAVLLALVGFFAAQLWPLTEAEAYDSFDGSARIVEAVSGVYGPFTQLLPWGIGWVADNAGLEAALGVLLLQPLVTGLVAIGFDRGST